MSTSAIPRSAIRQVEQDHELRLWSTTNRDVVTHHAGCVCDSADIEFDWYEREAQHREHLHTAIFEAGRDAANQEVARAVIDGVKRARCQLGLFDGGVA